MSPLHPEQGGGGGGGLCPSIEQLQMEALIPPSSLWTSKGESLLEPLLLPQELTSTAAAVEHSVHMLCFTPLKPSCDAA